MKNRNKWLGLILSIGVLGSSVVYAKAPIKVVYCGEQIEFNQPPKVINNTVMLPLRVLSERFEYEVSWNQNTKTVTVSKGNNKVILVVGKKEAQVNEEIVPLNVAPIQKNGTIYVPLKVISDAMDMMVSWDSKTQTVTLKGKYEYDEKTENLILNTKNEVKIIGHVKNYDTGYIPQVNVEITPCGNEIVTVFQWTSGE